MKIKVKKLSESASLPERGSAFAAGYDLRADIPGEITILPHENILIPTGLSMEIPEGYFGGIFARSGLASKENLRPANCVGVIDSDYRGPVMVSLHNDSKETRIISPQERIAQLVIIPFLAADFDEAEELDETDRGAGGFGSTGKE